MKHIFESKDFLLKTKLESISEFGRYLESLNSNGNNSIISILQFYSNRVRRIYGIPKNSSSMIVSISKSKISKYAMDFDQVVSINQDKKEDIVKIIDSLYTISKSKKHKLEMIHIIKDIFIEMEDANILKIGEIKPVYDINVKNPDGSLIPRLIIQIKQLPKVNWDAKYKKLDNHPVYGLDPILNGYGFKISEVSGRPKIYSDRILIEQIN